jgi:hypothetical protein
VHKKRGFAALRGAAEQKIKKDLLGIKKKKRKKGRDE